MRCQANLDLESDLGTFLDYDSRLLVEWFEEIIQKNKWHNNAISAVMKSAFDGKIGPSQLDFAVQVKRFVVNYQRFLILSTLYIQAVYKLFVSVSVKDRKKMSYKKFTALLNDENRIFWQPGEFPCLCCIYTRVAPESIVKSVTYNLKRSRGEAVAALPNTAVRKEFRKVLRDNATSFIAVLDKFGVFYWTYIDGSLKKYEDLLDAIESQAISRMETKTVYDLLNKFLKPLAANLHQALMNRVVVENRLKDMGSKLCVTTQVREAGYVLNHVVNSGRTQKPTEDRQHTPKNEPKHPKNTHQTKQRARSAASAEPVAGSLAESDAVLAMTVNLSMNLKRLKTKITKMPKVLDAHKQSTQQWLTEAFTKIKAIHGDLHKPELDHTHPDIPQQKIDRLKSKVNNKLNEIEQLEKRFNACYLCAHQFIHDEHVERFGPLISAMDQTVATHEDYQKIALKAEKAEDSLKNFVDCCGKIYAFKEAVVPTCCTFHQQWEMVRASFQAQDAERLEPQRPGTMVPPAEDKLKALNTKVQSLYEETQQILVHINHRSEVMELIMRRVEHLLSTHVIKDSCVHQAKDDYRSSQSQLYTHGHCELERLQSLLHKSVSEVSRKLRRSIAKSQSRVTALRQAYDAFLGSCEALEGVYEKVLDTHELSAFQQHLPDGMSVFPISAQGDQFCESVGLILGQSPESIAASTKSIASQSAATDANADLAEMLTRVQNESKPFLVILNTTGTIVRGAPAPPDTACRMVFLMAHDQKYYPILLRPGLSDTDAYAQLIAHQERFSTPPHAHETCEKDRACCDCQADEKPSTEDTHACLPSSNRDLDGQAVVSVDPLNAAVIRYLSRDLLLALGYTPQELTGALAEKSDTRSPQPTGRSLGFFSSPEETITKAVVEDACFEHGFTSDSVRVACPKFT